MADTNPKRAPGGAPSHLTDLDAQLRRAAAEPGAAQALRIRMTVSGGMPTERYDFRFEVTGDGQADCAVSSVMEERTSEVSPGRLPEERWGEASTGRIPEESVTRLLGAISLRGMAEGARRTVPIPPDSLVGRLEVSDGKGTLSIVFMADPEQAKTAGFVMPPEVISVVDTIYVLAADLLKVQNVRP